MNGPKTFRLRLNRPCKSIVAFAILTVDISISGPSTLGPTQMIVFNLLRGINTGCWQKLVSHLTDFYGVLNGVASLLQINSASSFGEVHSSLLNGVASDDDAT